MTYKMLTNHENSFNVIKKLSPIMTRNYTIPYFGSINNHEFNQKCTFFNVFKFHFHLTIKRAHRNIRLLEEHSNHEHSENFCPCDARC